VIPFAGKFELKVVTNLTIAFSLYHLGSTTWAPPGGAIPVIVSRGFRGRGNFSGVEIPINLTC